MDENALSVRNLKKTYGNGVEALKGISFQVKRGDFMALLGPNGAGKSTTIGIVSSLINKTGGEVVIFDQNIDTDFARAKKYIGVVPQEFNFNLFEKVKDILFFQAGYFGIAAKTAALRVEKYLRLLDIWNKRNEPSQMLSGGMKRRLMIARALVHEPKLLILDEPTAGVDIELRRSMWNFLVELNRNGTTIILTTHYLEEAEHLCRTIAIINRGELVEYTTMKTLLAKLDKETFVLDLESAIQQPIALPNCVIRLVDPVTLEVDITKERSLNELFHALESNHIKVKSLRNKTNRLEELFVNLVRNGRNDTRHPHVS